MQTPRFRIEGELSSKPARFYLGNLEVPLEYEAGQRRVRGRTGNLAQVVLKESTIPDAGYGVHLRQAVAAKQLLLVYWGTKVSMKDADRLKLKVLILCLVTLFLQFPVK